MSWYARTNVESKGHFPQNTGSNETSARISLFPFVPETLPTQQEDESWGFESPSQG